MTKCVPFVLASALALLLAGGAYWMGWRQGKATASHAALLQSRQASDIFDLRSKCADLGEKILKSNPASPVIASSVLSHYNPRTNRCFAELDNEYSRRLFDGQTGERLAELWNGPIPTAYLKGVPGASREATRTFIDSHMADDPKR
jgi:hypothetical protein